jgi:alpha-tubulin suppressor-like RCC1 family protein
MKKHFSKSFGCIALVISIHCLSFPALSLASTQVVAWGAGTNSTVYTPNYGQCIVPVNLTNAIAIAAGYVHSLALTADGKVVTWSSADATMPPTTNAVAIAAGHNAEHSLVLQADGRVVVGGNDCCGLAAIPTNSNLVAVVGGWQFASALTTDGTVLSWGTNQFSGPWSNAVAVSAGYDAGLVLKADGTVVKWRYIGFGGITNVDVPADLTNVVAIAAGGYYQDLALKADGSVVAWSSSGLISVPAGLSNVVAISAGDFHSLALKADGTVVAWGDNSYGQTNVPAGLSNVVAIAAGGYHNLALVGDGPPVLRAPMTNPAIGANGFSVSLSSQSGRVYALEHKNSLADSNWTASPLVAGTGGQLTLIDRAVTNSQRFYRVRRW